MKYVPHYLTRDRFEIFTLLASSCEVDGYELKKGSVCFRFADKNKCEQILKQLLSKNLQVYAHEMIDAIRTTQSIFNKK